MAETETVFPLDAVETPTLDEWAADGGLHLDPGWGTWVAPDDVGAYRIQVEYVDLPVPHHDRIADGYEIRLESYDPRPVREFVRETVGNAAAALLLADRIAAASERFATGDFAEATTPRPERIGTSFDERELAEERSGQERRVRDDA